MASSLEFVSFVTEQLSGAGTITYKRMFGEYGIYCDGTYFSCICGNRYLVKITGPGEDMLPGCPRELPYEGGSPMFLIEDQDNRRLLCELAQATCAALRKRL